MRKIILLCAFGLIGTFTLANQSNEATYKVDEITYKMNYSSAGGWCTVYIMKGNEVVMTNTSWQESESDCSTWAAGQYWSYMLSIIPMT